MPFSASTCLTYTGTTTLTNPISIYSDSDSYLLPFTSITLSQITSGNCPLVLTGIPDGTTTIRLKSANSFCCNIVLTCNDLCTTCDLAFDAYSTSLVSRIVAGNLTGSCDNNITQYKINWFKDGGLIPVFTSGHGTEFQPYNFTHPLVGVASPMQTSGIYTPVVDKVKLNGLNYSQTGGTGFIQANLECFNSSTIEVLPFNCGNGTETSGNYTHRVQFSGASAGVVPLTLTSTFDLDLTTNYFAWKFQGESIPDSLKISFHGLSYTDPIILEYWVVGGTLSNDVSLTTFPKSARTDYFVTKVTSLTTLSRNVGDYLTLEVIPSQSNPQTNWDFYFRCLNTFNCSTCIDSYLNTNTPYKIQTSSVTNPIYDSCGKRNVIYYVSGCTNNLFNSSDIGKYMSSSFYNIGIYPSGLLTNDTTSLLGVNQVYYTGSTQCGVGGQGYPPVCREPANTNTIRFEKTISAGVGVINMVFSDLNDLIAYKSSYDFQKIGWVNDPTNFNYYQYVQLLVPNTTGSETCGDGTTSIFYNIHFSSIMTTGGTAGNYTLTMPMPTITNSMPVFTPCEQGCTQAPIDVVNSVNTASTGTTNNTIKLTNTGSRYVFPFAWRYYASYSVSSTQYSGTSEGIFVVNDSLNSTVPFSGYSYPYVQIPALSSQTCDYSSVGEVYGAGYDYQSKYIYIYDYIVVMTNPPDMTIFSIKANTIVNGIRTSTNFPITALTYSGGTVTYANPLYTF